MIKKISAKNFTVYLLVFYLLYEKYSSGSVEVEGLTQEWCLNPSGAVLLNLRFMNYKQTCTISGSSVMEKCYFEKPICTCRRLSKEKIAKEGENSLHGLYWEVPADPSKSWSTQTSRPPDMVLLNWSWIPWVIVRQHTPPWQCCWWTTDQSFLQSKALTEEVIKHQE